LISRAVSQRNGLTKTLSPKHGKSAIVTSAKIPVYVENGRTRGRAGDRQRRMHITTRLLCNHCCLFQRQNNCETFEPSRELVQMNAYTNT